MNHREQQIRIAEFCGWTNIHETGRLDRQSVGTRPYSPVIGEFEELPDYLHDLNAMHAAEAALKPSQITPYAEAIRGIVGRDYDSIGHGLSRFSDRDWIFAYTHVTAAQRAEGFLKTIGKLAD